MEAWCCTEAGGLQTTCGSSLAAQDCSAADGGVEGCGGEVVEVEAALAVEDAGSSDG